ncbi:hypothetical protein Tco_1289655, partial [Tanacetum coccineum]
LFAVDGLDRTERGCQGRGGSISWASKKQTRISGSTMKFEFVALAVVGKEAEWLRNLIHEIRIWPKPITPISIHCDSAATLAKAVKCVMASLDTWVLDIVRLGS